jgi:hypothetical protein
MIGCLDGVSAFSLRFFPDSESLKLRNATARRSDAATRIKYVGGPLLRPEQKQEPSFEYDEC